jgi:hypothetical protein
MVEFSDNATSSAGGRVIDRLAGEFGLSSEEANAAVEALMPGIAARVRSKAADPAGFLSLLGVPGAAQPLAAVGDPTALPLSEADRDAIVTRAAGATGLAPDLLSKMLPVLGSFVVSAIVNAIQSRGLGGLGAILSQILGGGQGQASPVPPQGPPSGPGGGIDLGTILEQVLRGGQGQASPVPPQGSPPGPGGGIDLGAILGQILGGGQGQASPVPPQGSPPGPGGGIDLGAILEQVLRGGQGQASPVPPQGSPSGPGGGIDLGTILEQVLRGGQGQASPVPPQGSPSGPGGGIDLGTILEQVLRGGQGQASPPLPGEPERPRGGLEDEIGKILRGTRD